MSCGCALPSPAGEAIRSIVADHVVEGTGGCCSVRHAPIVRHQQVSAVVDGDAAELPELVRAIQRRAASVTVRRATLNDVFLQLTAGEHTPVAVGG